MDKPQQPHIGSTLDSLLEETGDLEEVNRRVQKSLLKEALIEGVEIRSSGANSHGNPYFCVSWTVKGIGWGEIGFYQDPDGVIHLDDETMGKDFAKRVLCQLIDNSTVD